MLADWTRCGQRHVAWLSLDAGDNDPVRFWRNVVAALDRARQGIAERGGPLLGPPAPSVFEGLVTALINKLAAQPSEAERALSSAIAQARTACAATMAAWVCHHLGLVQRAQGRPGRSPRHLPADAGGQRGARPASRAWPMWAWVRRPASGTT